MAFWHKTNTLSTAIHDWQERGLLDAATAETLSADIKAQKSGYSFQSILILLAIICLGFGAITFVAANWDEIGRLTRVGIVFGSMWAAWGAAIFARRKNHAILTECLIMLASILFGAGIMLISQIYHMQGEAKDAVWLWAIGALLAAALTRSKFTLSLAIILLSVWSFMEADLFSRRHQVRFDFLAYLALCAVIARWMHSRFAAHLILLSLTSWVCVNTALEYDQHAYSFMVIALYLTYALLAVALFFEGSKNILRGFEKPLIAHLIFTNGFLTLMWFITAHEGHSGNDILMFSQPILIPTITFITVAALGILARSKGNQNTYDLAITAIAIAITGILLALPSAVPFLFEAFLLALTIWVIRMGWRLEYRPVTVLGFLGFAGVMTLIYFITIGTLLGTSAFYIGVGVLLLLGVFLAPRLLPKKGGTS